MTATYYLWHEGEQRGPLGLAEIAALCRQGLIGPAAVWWYQMGAAWRPLAELLEIPPVDAPLDLSEHIEPGSGIDAEFLRELKAELQAQLGIDPTAPPPARPRTP